ncbi:MAG: UbiA prenyltransferase family protein [Candidatus Brocadiaceae bacterium]|nr:UbiA prenyltransferase family protein [Candidatus Brocadiaceae bacterium]
MDNRSDKMFETIFRLVRVGQWYKNLAVLFPLLFAPQYLLYSWLEYLIAFSGFCLASSITYIVNDWMDRESDRLHPVKKNRPLASGAISGTQAAVIVFILFLFVLTACFYLGIFYGLVILTYVVFTNAYSFGLKNVPVLDILLISLNFVLRTGAGINTFAPGQIWPYYLLIFTVIALLLSHKRSSDVKIVGEDAIKHKPVLRFYTKRNTYIVRVLAYFILLIVFYALFQQGVSFLILLALAAILGLTSIALSLRPEITLRPKYLFTIWYWDIALIVLIVVVCKDKNIFF